MKHTINQFIGFLPEPAEDELSAKTNLFKEKLSEACRS